MRRSSALGAAMLWLSCLGLLLPPSAVAAARPQSGSAKVARKVQMGDAALGPHGTLRGRVVDRQGTALPSVGVVLMQGGRPIAQAATDSQGRFAMANIRRGVYVASAAGGVGVYRVWPARIAPPSAKPGVLLVAGGQTVRGQNGAYQWVSEHYLLTITGIAAAITVPIVLINADKDRRPSTP